MKFWWLALKDLMLIVRDKKAFLTLILMPLLLIAILGASFGNMMSEKEVTLNKFTLGVADLDEGPLSKILVNEVLEKGLSKQIKVKRYSENVVNNKIKNHNLSVGIVIMPGFSNAIMTGKQAEVKLLTIPDPGVKAMIIESILDQFSQSITAEARSSVKFPQRENAQNNSIGSSGSLENSIQINQPAIHETTITEKTKPVGSFQYYAAAMGVMFLLMTVVQGVSAMILEKEQEVYNRLLLSNLTYLDYLTGKMLGLFIICLLQAFIIIFGTMIIYRVDWGNSFIGVAFITLAYVFSGCGLGILAGAFMKTEKSFGVAGMFGTQLLAVLGGSMAPIYIFPHWLVSVIRFLPNGLALQTYLKLMSGNSFADILPAGAVLFGSGLLFLTIGLYRLSIERRGRYA